MSDPNSIFILKLSADGSILMFSTYFGGEEGARLGGMTLDETGNVYITGTTRSTNLPTTTGAFQEEFVGEILGCEEGFPPVDVNSEDAFLFKLATDGSGITYGTYLGGSHIDKGSDVAVEHGGNAYVAGSTSSMDYLSTGNAGASIFFAGSMQRAVFCYLH